MEDIFKEVLCCVGCVHLCLHLAYLLTSVAESISRRDKKAGPKTWANRSPMFDGNVNKNRQDTASFEHKASS